VTPVRAATAVAGCVLAAALAGAMAAPAARAQSCQASNITAGSNVNLDVSSVTVTKGGCVQFANYTQVTVTVKVSGSSFSEQIPGRTPAYATTPYVATQSATATATDGVRSGNGQITVVQPSPTPSTTADPATTSYGAPPQVSVAPSRTFAPLSAPPAPANQSGSTQSNSSSGLFLPVLPSYPTGGGGPPTASQPVVAPQAPERGALAASGSVVLDPASAADRGLPATVAAVVLVGIAVAFGRTLLAAAPAVDRARMARRRA
jgi:hypothetical protein